MRTRFFEDLEQLADQFDTRCLGDRAAIAAATGGLLNADPQQCERAIEICQELDGSRDRCDDTAAALLALQSPVAGELRKVVTALQLVANLHRMGALTVHIADIARRRHPEHVVPESMRPIVARMGAAAVAMATAAAAVLAAGDPRRRRVRRPGRHRGPVTPPGRSERARVGRHRPRTRRSDSSPCVRRCRSTDVARQRIDALLQETCLVTGQHGARITEMLDDEVAHIATHALDVPVRSAQQPLHSIRNPLTSAFGQSPPVLTFQTRDQTRLYLPGGLVIRDSPLSINESSSATARSNTTRQVYQHRTTRVQLQY